MFVFLGGNLLGLFAKAFLVDSVIESLNTCKYFVVITNKREEISEYIIKTLVAQKSEISVFVLNIDLLKRRTRASGGSLFGKKLRKNF